MINKNYELIIKDNYLDIKYYSKIIDINSLKIEILLDSKKIIINGNNLIIRCMDEYEIVIKGIISSIQFIDE